MTDIGKDFLVEHLSDYMIWKAARLLEPSYLTIYNIGLRLGGDVASIEDIYSDIGANFPSNVRDEQFFRMCITRIMLRQRNILSEKKINFVHMLFSVFCDLGLKSEILDICLVSYAKIIQLINNLETWKQFILLVRGPYPTLDSEMYLNKLVFDIGEKYSHMKRVKHDMNNLIHTSNLNNVNIKSSK